MLIAFGFGSIRQIFTPHETQPDQLIIDNTNSHRTLSAINKINLQGSVICGRRITLPWKVFDGFPFNSIMKYFLTNIFCLPQSQMFRRRKNLKDQCTSKISQNSFNLNLNSYLRTNILTEVTLHLTILSWGFLPSQSKMTLKIKKSLKRVSRAHSASWKIENVSI